MPIRRPSQASAGIIPTSTGSSTLAHKSTDSHHVFAQQHSLISLGATATPQQKIVQVLVHRLKNKLPCNSGLTLDRLEADSATQQAISALVELSRDSLDMIAWALTELLDRLAKTDLPRLLSIEVLQSQLFLLKVLSMTMASRWNHNPRSSSRSSDRPSMSSPDSPATANSKRSRQTSFDPPGSPLWMELPPMDDNIAKYVLSVMVLFLRHTSSEASLVLATRSTDIAFRDFDAIDIVNAGTDSAENLDIHSQMEPSLRAQSSSGSVKSSKLSISSSIFPSATKTFYEKTHMSLVKSPASINALIAKFAGRIIFHISASNWSTVFVRLRKKIRNIAENLEETPDIVDLQLMAHSALDRHRLVQLLNELSSLLVNMGQDAQLAVAVPLRSAIWNWIDVFPAEFNEAIRVRGKTEGAPERVFDLLYSMNQAACERIFWPTLTILNGITADRIPAEFQIAQYGGLTQKTNRKEMKFMEDILRHARNGSKLAEVSLVCAVDTCRAAMYVTADGEVPLRMIAHDVAHEIKSGLTTNSRRPFWDSQEDIDVALYADALVAIYRFLPLEDSLPLFSACVDPERSEAAKTCVVRACLTLVQEASRFPWQKPLEDLHIAMAVRFREIMKNAGLRLLEVDSLGHRKRSSPHPKAKRTIPEPLSDREILILGILSLWRSDSLFIMKNIDQAEFNKLILVSIKLWEASVDIAVKVSIASCLRKLSENTFSLPMTDSSHTVMLDLIKSSWPITLLSVVGNLLNCRQDLELQRLWMAISHQFLELYVRKTDSHHVQTFQLDTGRIPAFALTEIAFLVSLTSADMGVSQSAAKGLRLLSHTERQPGAPINPAVSDEDRSKRNPIYEQLGDPKVLVVGRIGYQKRIRKLVRLISYSSAVHIAVWEECYWRWRSLSESIFESVFENQDSNANRNNPPAVQDLRFQWQNLTLFLAALGGACVQEKHDLTSLTSVIPPQYLPDKMRVLQSPVPLVEAFITDLINLLVVPDMPIREVARDALGAELSPRLYSKLLKNLDESMRGVEQGAGTELNDRYLLFLDQFIAILKLLVENSHVGLEDMMSIDMSSTMLTLANFIARFGGLASFRIKTKYCVLCDSICDRTDTFILRKDTNARHSILDIVLDWIEPVYDRGGESAHYFNELNMACLRTFVNLLDRLQLKPIDGANTGDDSVHVVSRLFGKYSSALLQSLDACQIDVLSSDTVSDVGSMHQKNRVSQREAELRELIITGLSHLVNANSESGFKQCLPLAYDQDNRKRTIFAHVFARVLGQGTKFDPEDRSASQARHTKLCDLVRGSDMVLALAICEICPPSDVELIISVLLNIFDTRSSLMGLLKVMIEREVAQTDNEANLFRSNSTCTRFLSAFARIHGYNYLRNLIQPLVDLMATMPSDYSYEVDPNKVSHEDASANQKNVEYVAQTFLGIMSASLPSLPGMFREICAHIAKVVAEIWPESKFAAMGAFIFLRFISPAVVAPEIVDIEVPKGETTVVIRRGLMVIAKIIQNLANNIFFGKEAHMVVLNKFLEGNIANVTRFLSELHKYTPINTEEDGDQWLGTTSDDTDLIVLHRFFDKHADKIGKELLSLSKPSIEGDSSAVGGKRAWDGLCALLVDLGPPLEVPRPSTMNSKTHKQYLDLLTRCRNRSTQSVQELFVETGVPVGSTAIFVFRLATIDVESLDVELLMYHIFKTLALPAYSSRQFEIILDCTSFTSMSEIPLQWLKYCAEIVPSDIRSRFSTTHILNPNALAQRFLRRLYNVCAGAHFCSDVKSYTSIFPLLGTVPKQAVVPLVYPASLEHEVLEDFKDVTMKVSHMRLPILLQIGTTHLKVTSIKTQLISPGFSCRSTEIIPLTDVSDIYNVSTGHEPHEFIIRRRQGITVYFSSASRENIVKLIRSAKGRLQEVQAPMTERFSRFSNVPATLLHVGLLSIDLKDEELRTAAYDLLGAVCSYLNYDKSPIIACKTGFIPGDPNAFALQLSERLADFAPQLTLDFIHEVSAAMTAMDKNGMAQRINCLQYMSPWISNLAHFCNSIHPLYERSGARLRDCVRTLSDLSVGFPEIASTIQKYIWHEVGKLDSTVVDIILDELVRTAADGGIGTARCETITHIVAALSSINVRGRIYSKLRKALSKMPPKLSNTLSEHPNWTEISTLIRLTLVVGSQPLQSTNNQLYIPEIIHLVTLVAGEGPSLVRKSVYGTIVNMLQSLYTSRTEDAPGSDLLQLIDDCTLPSTLKLFGLGRDTPTSEYTNIDPINDKDYLDRQELLAQLLVRIMDVAAGSRGLLNVWRARWMSLVTSTAFQLSPAVQTRSFIALGALAVADVDDDFVYQILVAFRSALSKANETHTMSVVSMLRCMCKIVPAMQQNSRYLCLLFWLAVALLQSSHFAFYIEATCLLRVTLESMEQQGMFKNNAMSFVLLEGRTILDEVASQLDEMLRLSFDTSFSFSMASIIFKGMRHSGLKDSAEAALRSLLRITIRSHMGSPEMSNGFQDILYHDALGYFLALIPVSTTPALYHKLIKDCGVNDAWLPDAGLPEPIVEEDVVPTVTPTFLGISNPNDALLTISFVGTMLATAQGDDAETEILYNLLSELANSFPDMMSITYESMQDKIKDTFANASNVSIIRSVSNIFRTAVHDTLRVNNGRGSSTSTLSTVEESVGGPGRPHLNALDELGMQGLANSFQFLPPNRGHATKMINWIPSLVSLMIA